MIGWWSMALGADLVVHGQQVLPVDGPPIEDGVVVIRDGRIAAIGRHGEVELPAGATELSGAVVTPGLVDGLSVVGLSGVLNRSPDQDHEEPGRAIAPELRALDAYDPYEPLVGWLRGFGVTTVQTGPSPGAPVGGRTLVAHTSSAPTELVALVPDGMLVVTLGEPAKDFPGARTRMGAAAQVRQAFTSAREYRERRRLPLADRAAVDLGQEALVDALEHRRRVIFVAEQADDLATALRIAKEYDLDAVLAGAAEGWLVRDAIAAAGVPVLVGPAMSRTWSTTETVNASFANAALLADAGIPIALMSGYEGYVPKVRVVLLEAQVAAREGLGAERALRAITLGPAEVLGVADRVGSLTPGKQADLVVFDGDPLEYTSHVCAVVLGGELVERTCR